MTAVTRSPERAAALRSAGMIPIVQDLAEPWQAGKLDGFDSVLYSVGFDRAGVHSMREVYVDGLRQVLAHLAETRRLIYVSSTGVYGDAEGELIDERSECHPQREGGRLCLEAEQLIRESDVAPVSLVLRAAGIYGPGRIPNRSALEKSGALQVEPDSWLNLIHVEDLASVIEHASDNVLPHDLYNVADGCPVQRRDYYGYLGKTLGMAAPQFAPIQPEGGEPRRGSSNKRIDASQLHDECPIRFRFPSYREGLDAEFSTA